MKTMKLIKYWLMLVACGAAAMGTAHAAASATSNDADAALIARGEYLAHAGDCMACHTAKNGKPFAGGLPLATPMGRIYATNITPDRQTGIGDWTYDDFARLMRTGQTREGYTVYPAMPYPSYSRVNDADMHALYAYFHEGVAPVDQPNRANEIPWPLSMRWPLRLWAWAFAPRPQPFTPTTLDSPSVSLGRYLVEGLGHCGSCHTARGVALEEKALTDADGLDYLEGGSVIDGWVAPSLRGDNRGGLGGWSEADIVAFLKTGRNAQTVSFGAMNDVIVNSTQHMNDTDLKSIALYLRSLAPAHNRAPYVKDDRVGLQMRDQQVPNEGAQIYLDRCAACHRADGSGAGVAFPALAGNPVLQTQDPTSAIHIVLSGGRQPSTQQAPSAFTMGPLGDVLNDEQVASVVTFIETAWGNKGGTASANDVKRIRENAVPVEAQSVVPAQPQLHHAAPRAPASGANAGLSGG